VRYLDEEGNTDMLLHAQPFDIINKPTVGIYRVVGRNDEAVTSETYAREFHSALEQIYTSAYWQNKAYFEDARQRLSATAYLAPAWDSDRAEPPNEVARSLAASILAGLEDASLPPTQLTPTVEGGIALSFVEGIKRAVIEIYNTGEIAAATYTDRDQPRVWEWESAEDSLVGSIEQIRVHLAA
jgi:hypothetical protein